MPPPDPRTTRQHLGLTAGQAARLFGVDGRAWRRMETEGAEPRGPLARLLALVLRLPGALGVLRDIADEDGPSQRSKE